MIESVESLRAFLRTTEWGVKVILDPLFSRVEIDGIYDNEFILLDTEMNAVATTDPNVMVVTEDVSSLSQHDLVEISGVSYTVKEIQPDGTGMTTLMLSKAD